MIYLLILIFFLLINKMERKALKAYKFCLKKVKQQIGHKGTTIGSELEKVGKYYLGDDFVGVFAQDMVPDMKHRQYSIVNVDTSDKGGSHWIAVKKNGGRHVVIYDSFGRSSKKLLPILERQFKVTDADYDAEQAYEEDNCGQRSLAFILVDYCLGEKYSILI
jgi:hypothetical protein